MPSDRPEKTAAPTHEIIFWDWKERPDFAWIDEVIGRVFDGQNAPRIHQIDTGQDAYAIVVAASEMAAEQVQAAWEVHGDDE